MWHFFFSKHKFEIIYFNRLFVYKYLFYKNYFSCIQKGCICVRESLIYYRIIAFLPVFYKSEKINIVKFNLHRPFNCVLRVYPNQLCFHLVPPPLPNLSNVFSWNMLLICWSGRYVFSRSAKLFEWAFPHYFDSISVWMLCVVYLLWLSCFRNRKYIVF